MNGPTFLLVYAVLAAGLLAVCRYMLVAGDASRRLPAPAVPLVPDPYEVAYLNDGSEGVLDVALLRLHQSGAIVPRDLHGRSDWTRVEGVAPAAGIEQIVAAALTVPLARKALAERVRGALETALEPLQRSARAALLLNPPDRMRAAWGYGLATGSALVIVALARVVRSLAHGFHNVGFLVLEALVALVALMFVCRIGRLSDRGTRYVKQLMQAFPPPAPEGQAEVAALLPVFVGLYGASALAGSAYADGAGGMRVRGGDGCSAHTCSSGGGDGGGGGGGCGGGGCGGH